MSYSATGRPPVGVLPQWASVPDQAPSLYTVLCQAGGVGVCSPHRSAASGPSAAPSARRDRRCSVRSLPPQRQHLSEPSAETKTESGWAQTGWHSAQDRHEVDRPAKTSQAHIGAAKTTDSPRHRARLGPRRTRTRAHRPKIDRPLPPRPVGNTSTTSKQAAKVPSSGFTEMCLMVEDACCCFTVFMNTVRFCDKLYRQMLESPVSAQDPGGQR